TAIHNGVNVEAVPPVPGATPNTAPLENPPAVTVNASFTNPQFAGAGALLPQGVSPTLSIRTAIVLGANDKLTEKILRNMADPSHYSKNVDIVFVIVQVSCNPGWRTKENYI